MAWRVRTVVFVTCTAAVVAFAVVQDRVTASGARTYVAMQRAAAPGNAPAVAIDDVMRPAIRRSVRYGVQSASLVLVAGGVVAAVVSRRNRRSGSSRNSQLESRS